jgi:transposase
MTRTALAEKLGISRRTLYHWVKTGQLDRDLDHEPVHYKARPPVARKIDRYKSIVHSRLEDYPEPTATRVFQEIRAAGYPGSYTRPRPPQEPVIRFETPPGQQGQVDFAHFRLPWGRRYALLGRWCMAPDFGASWW